jgi:hypothetical protein
MTTVEKIEKAVAALSAAELAEFSAWFEAFQNNLWDRRIVRDGAEGKLDALSAAARAEHRAGRTKPH